MASVTFLLLIVNCWWCISALDTMLEPQHDVCAYPEEEISLICNVTNNLLTWMWNNTASNGRITYIPNFIRTNPLINVTQNLMGVPEVTTTLLEFNFINDTTYYFTSKLQFVVANELVPANICCNYECRIVKEKEINFTMISYIEVHEFFNNSENSTVTFTWGPNTNTNTYIITISSGEAKPNITVTNSVFINITLQYNNMYIVNITTDNCNENNTIYKIINLVKCEDPRYLPGVEAMSYSGATYEGSIFTYYCCNGNTSSNSILRSICRNTKQWEPNINCSAQIMCDSPVLDPNTQIVNTSGNGSFGGFLHYVCREGFLPTYVVKSTCTNKGEWQPNPLKHTCQICGVNKSSLSTSTFASALVSAFVMAVLSTLVAFIGGWKLSFHFHHKKLQDPAACKISENHHNTPSVVSNLISEDASVPKFETTPMYEEVILKSEDDNIATTKNLAYGNFLKKDKQ